MTGRQYYDWINALKANGNLPAEMGWVDLARALTSSLYGNERIRCRKGADQAELHRIAAELKAAEPQALVYEEGVQEAKRIVNALFEWGKIADWHKKEVIVVLPCTCVNEAGDRVEAFVNVREGGDFLHPARAVTMERMYAFADECSFITEGELDVSRVHFDEKLHVRLYLTHNGSSGEIRCNMNELANGEIPVGYRALNKKGLTLPEIEGIDAEIDVDPEPRELRSVEEKTPARKTEAKPMEKAVVSPVAKPVAAVKAPAKLRRAVPRQIITNIINNQNSRSRFVYVVLAIIFGGFGVHNMYIGHIFVGFLQLSVTLFTGGVGLFVVLPWVFLEILLTTRDCNGNKLT